MLAVCATSIAMRKLMADSYGENYVVWKFMAKLMGTLWIRALVLVVIVGLASVALAYPPRRKPTSTRARDLDEE